MGKNVAIRAEIDGHIRKTGALLKDELSVRGRNAINLSGNVPVNVPSHLKGAVEEMPYVF